MASPDIRPFYQSIEGINFPFMFDPRKVRETLNYKPIPQDIFVVTYPKCGSTWMKTITFYILRKGKELENFKEFSTMCPFIDRFGNEGISNMPRPGPFQTHLPFTHVPYSPNAKYIYVIRNPKDCCVSMFYQTKKLAGYWEATFNDFFEIFMTGEVGYNDYFDHLSSWYPHRNDRNTFFTTYEKMKENTKDIILELASFLGTEYIEAIEKDNNILNNILQYSAFDYMKDNMIGAFRPQPGKDKHEQPADVNLPEHIKIAMTRERPEELKQVPFIRKGIVGDWRNHFSEEQSQRMNQKFLERTKGTDIQEMYKHIMC